VVTGGHRTKHRREGGSLVKHGKDDVRHGLKSCTMLHYEWRNTGPWRRSPPMSEGGTCSALSDPAWAQRLRRGPSGCSRELTDDAVEAWVIFVVVGEPRRVLAENQAK